MINSCMFGAINTCSMERYSDYFVLHSYIDVLVSRGKRKFVFFSEGFDFKNLSYSIYLKLFVFFYVKILYLLIFLFL